MKKTGLVIDSTTILSDEIIKKYNIQIVSLNILVNETTKKELETTDQEIVEHLNDVKGMKSSSPSPQEFMDAYQKLFDLGYEKLIVVPLSKELSSTYQSAVIARDEMDEKNNIFVIDTNICNYGNVNLIESILPLIDVDIPTEEIVRELKQRVLDSNVQFTIIDLKHLVRGGRLSKISGTLGTLFKIKPIVEMIDGKLKVAQKKRTYPDVLKVFVDKVGKYAETFKTVSLKIVQLGQEALAKQLEKEVQDKHSNVIISAITRIGPVFHIHLGNSGIGIAITAYN